MFDLLFLQVVPQRLASKHREEDISRLNKGELLILPCVLLKHSLHFVHDLQPVLDWHLQVQEHQPNGINDAGLLQHDGLLNDILNFVNDFLAVDVKVTHLDNLRFLQYQLCDAQVQCLVVRNDNLAAY